MARPDRHQPDPRRLPGKYWHIALRDLGLMMSAVALTILATKYTPLDRPGGPPANW
jgi:hypothetical protein